MKCNYKMHTEKPRPRILQFKEEYYKWDSVSKKYIRWYPYGR